MEWSLLIITNYEYLHILQTPTVHEKKHKLNAETETTEDISQRKQYEKKSHKRRLIK
jgi:hypothetical protein